MLLTMLILLMYVSYRYLATISINALTRCKVFVVTYNYVIISKVAYFSINQSKFISDTTGP